MSKKERIASLAAIGVLGVVGAAYALITHMDDVLIEDDLVVEGGNVDVGVADTTLGTLTLHNDGTTHDGGEIVFENYYRNWSAHNSNGHLYLTTNVSSTDPTVIVRNYNGSGTAGLTLYNGSLKVRDGDANIEDGDLNLDNGGVVFKQGTTNDAFITSNSDGDVIVQLGS